jgi:hypothetical protein
MGLDTVVWYVSTNISVLMYHTTEHCIPEELITTTKTSNLTQDKGVSVIVKLLSRARAHVCACVCHYYYLAVTGPLIQHTDECHILQVWALSLL